MMYELHVIRALQAELASQMTGEEWQEHQEATIDRFLAEGGMERVVTPPETVPRIMRRSASKSATGAPGL